LEPQAVPAGTLPVPSTQVIAPVAQDVTPALHGAGLLLQDWPAVQATQLPLPLHTRLVPQLVPAALLVSSPHVCTPVLHEVMPLTQAAFGFVAHTWPGVQSVHCPFALHT
jgi:hypothetical protein